MCDTAAAAAVTDFVIIVTNKTLTFKCTRTSTCKKRAHEMEML